MPRKQRGWGSSKSLAFKPIQPINKGKLPGAAGSYPSDRRYGSSVSRSVIEKYDMDSDWAKWRKGFEYYNQAAWAELVQVNPLYGTLGRLELAEYVKEYGEEPPQYIEAILDSVLYQGTEYELPTTFTAKEFPGKDSDTSTHYVVRRDLKDDADIDLGTITEVYNNERLYPDQKALREIWCKGVASTSSPLILQMAGERITDGVTEATVKFVLTEDEKPTVYLGKTYPSEETDIGLQGAKINLKIPLSNITLGDQEEGRVYSNGLSSFIGQQNANTILDAAQQLVGDVIYVPDFYIQKPLADVDGYEWADSADFFGITLIDTIDNADVVCLDPGANALPPSMLDIQDLPNLFTATDAEIEVRGTYVFDKKQYNRFFQGYITTQNMKEQADSLSYAVLPFTIESAYIDPDDNLVIASIPVPSEVKIYPAPSGNRTIVFTDWSFCSYSYENINGKDWKVLNTDVLPWQDEVFTSGNPLKPAQTYSCSCADHSHSMVAAPQATTDQGTRKQNRQLRYPLPTVLGLDRWQGLGLDQTAGKVASWDTYEHRYGFRLCKHAIAARFIDGIKTQEPSKYPSVDARISFEEKLRKEINEFSGTFLQSYRRSQISVAEIVFALAAGLNLDGIETAYVLFNTD